jgi:hypothetical protein
VSVLLAPRPDAERVYTDAKQICRNKAKLRRSQSNDTDDQAVDNGNKEPGPRFSSDEDCRQDGETTRNIIQMEHSKAKLPRIGRRSVSIKPDENGWRYWTMVPIHTLVSTATVQSHGTARGHVVFVRSVILPSLIVNR